LKKEAKPFASFAFARPLAYAPRPMSDTIVSPLHQAREAERAGDLTGADAIYHAAHNPQTPDAALLMNWARLRRHIGDRENARRMFGLAGRAGAGVDALLELASMALDENRVADATPLLQQAARLGHGPGLDYQRARWEAAQGRHDHAARLFRNVIKAEPRNLEARIGHARVLAYGNRAQESEAAYKALLQRAPEYQPALTDLAYMYGNQRRFPEALALYDRLDQLGAEVAREFSQVALGMMHMCDWSHRAALRACLAARVAKPVPCVTEAYAFFASEDDPALHRQMADRFADAIKAFSATRERPPARLVGPPERRLRVGYLCGDFNQHATSLLLAGVLEAHNRDRFEITAYDYSPEDGTPIRARMRAAFEHFVSLGNEGPEASAKRIAGDGIDVLVDVKGYTERTRSEIMALRPAPVQVNFLGYVGTQAGDWIDYIIADATVLPQDERVHYTEAAVEMPVSWQPNDRSRPRPAVDTDRAAQGLPAEGIVFACFNSPFKISPEIFAVWMDILRDETGSVLWLFEGNQFVGRNLRAEAEKAGIDPARLVFAKPAKLEEHLARHGCADLFLDTLPYGAHTTAADALWAGLPIVTCMGRSWASRVGASLLHAVGLPELIATSLPEYKALVLDLARDPARRASLRDKLLAARDTAPLFDAPAFARALEDAYTEMANRARAGQAPAAFAVAMPK
jgi:predicted O-linked N-acetylglucosamine transferase (SPINDLY family)